MYLTHKVHIYKEYHSVCPLVGTGTLPPPLSPASVPLPPEPKGGEAYSPAGRGLGESQFRRLEKKLTTLLTRWYAVCTGHFFVARPCLIRSSILAISNALMLRKFLSWSRMDKGGSKRGPLLLF